MSKGPVRLRPEDEGARPCDRIPSVQTAVAALVLIALLHGCRNVTVVQSSSDVNTPDATPSLDADSTAPVISGFSMPLTSTSLEVSGITLIATDNVAVTGYFLSEVAATPAPNANGWHEAAPTSYNFTGIIQGIPTNKTLYAWAKDFAGNVSSSLSANVTITLTDAIPPAIIGFALAPSSDALTVPVTTFSATDNVRVTAYLVSESAAQPGSGAAGWSTVAPATYTFASAGSKTLYAWAKDAAGNVSAAKSATTTITLPNPSDPITSIIVQEALPAGVSGMARDSAPVTVGIPLPDTRNISSINQLGLSGAAAAQFRPLAWWPSGNIRWVLVDFQTDLAAGGARSDIALVPGSGNFGGSNLATDVGGAIRIDTGTAQFIIRKTKFNVFDSVAVGNRTIVTTGNAGRVSAVGPDGTVYTSANDTSSQAMIEENGPLRSVVKASGILKSESGLRLMDYTLRFTFFKGRSEAKAALSLRNANRANNYSIAFKSAEVIVPLSLSGAASVNLSLKTTSVSAPLSGTAVLQQGFNNAYSYPYGTATYNWDPPIPGTTATVYAYDTAYQGLHAKIGDQVVNAFGTLSDWTQGYAQVFDTSGSGLSVAFKDMKGYWPASFEIKDTGEFSVEPYGKWTNKSNKLPWGKHTTREWMWNFHTSAIDPLSVLYDVQYPALARAPLSFYAETKAFGQRELATPAEEAAFYTSLGKTAPALANATVTEFFRVWAWSVGGGTNQSNFALIDLYDYLRTGNGVFWQRGEQRTLFQIDAAVKHSDDYTTERIVENTDADPMPTSKGVNGVFIDMEHAHILSLPMYYFLTGNESAKDAFVDYCELLWRTDQTGPMYPKAPLDGQWHQMRTNPYLRALSRKIRNMAIAHEFTSMIGNNTINYKIDVENMVNTFLDSRETPALGATFNGNGRNLERGYLYWDTTVSAPKRVIHSLFHMQMLFEDLWQVRRVMLDTAWNYNRIDDFDDFLSGMSLFFLKDYLSLYDPTDPYYVNKGFRYKYIYNLDLDAVPASGEEAYPFDTSRAGVWAYQQTGDSTLLDKANLLLYESAEYENKRRLSEVQAQSLVWAFAKKSSIPTWQDVPLTVVDNGNGSYTLNWTVPVGATKLKIKHSDKRIVDWLGFDKATRTYQYDPAQYTAFFAAKNILSNPVPAAGGSSQSITVTGLPESQHFSAKVLIGGN